ncbi:MAG: ubiquinone biosynthesis regulatory protein kinase UbiB, partial [Burkholderiaceae bacterium]|nr:ubiquinone biosynthesis regulatory protein kinase UbiB [Burkholderiaceae bacterium]
LDQEAMQWSQLLPQIPRLVHANLNRPDPGPKQAFELERIRRLQEQTNRLLTTLAAILAIALGVAVWALTRH